MSREESTSVANADEDSGTTASDTDHESENSTQSPLPKDLIFSLLSVERRRRVITYLDTNEGETTVGELAEEIAALENDTEIRLLSSQQRKRVYVGLYQCHLPKLDDADVIEFNQSRGTVTRRANADQLAPYLALDPMVAAEAGSDQADEQATLRERLVENSL